MRLVINVCTIAAQCVRNVVCIFAPIYIPVDDLERPWTMSFLYYTKCFTTYNTMCDTLSINNNVSIFCDLHCC